MFNRSDYRMNTPETVINIIEAYHVNDEMSDDEWGDDLGDALADAVEYIDNHNVGELMAALIRDAADWWNNEGNMRNAIAQLSTAYRRDR